MISESFTAYLSQVCLIYCVICYRILYSPTLMSNHWCERVCWRAQID